jgi:hypothetical protein
MHWYKKGSHTKVCVCACVCVCVGGGGGPCLQRVCERMSVGLQNAPLPEAGDVSPSGVREGGGAVAALGAKASRCLLTFVPLHLCMSSALEAQTKQLPGVDGHVRRLRAAGTWCPCIAKAAACAHARET